jgi:IS30 family transposase
MRHYRQLTQEERYQISALKQLGHTQRQIAQALGRSPSTISRELRRNQEGHGYAAEEAQRITDKRRRAARKAHKRLPELITWVEGRLREDWSPEQIAGLARAVGYPLVSHEWIYRHIERDKAAGGELYKHLRHRRKRYRKRYGSQERRGRIIDRVGIEVRPAVVDERTRLGDWEGDTVRGKGRSALVTLVERKSLQVVIQKVERATAEQTAAAITKRLGAVAEQVATITFDNGKEFAYHKQIAEALGCEVYFARPYHSWERGTNENMNGLIRQYFPKGTDFDQVTDEEIAAVERKLNMRPRKRLGYRAPIEVFCEGLQRQDTTQGGVAVIG